jgi:hypothetical protein
MVYLFASAGRFPAGALFGQDLTAILRRGWKVAARRLQRTLVLE